MKQLTRGLTLILALCLLAACAAAAEPALALCGGIHWDTPSEQMLIAEGVAEGGYVQHNDGRGYTFYYIKGRDLYYVYRGERLLQAYCVLPASAYAAELDTRTAQYGTPADISADTISTLINTMMGSGTVAPEAFTNVAAWRLDGGTFAALFSIDDKAYMAYFHEQRILSGQ